MAAIYQALKLAWKMFPKLITVQFGFPYTDTLRLQEKFGFGCKFFGFGDLKDLNKLRKILQSGERISALFCEFPSNPLLYCVDLGEIRNLANEFNFLVIIDDTIGSLVNVDILKFSDILVTSLTKTFSGTGNVMAGSLILNPNSKHHAVLHKLIDSTFEDAFWCHDAAVLELNSRDFDKRVASSSQSAEEIVDFLINHPKGIIRIF